MEAMNTEPTVEGAGEASTPPEPALFTIRAHEHRSTLASLKEVIRYREVMQSFASRNIRLKYKQASLGFLWAVLQPLVFVATFTVFFDHVAHVTVGGGVPYAAFSMSVVIPWQFVSNATLQASAGFLSEAGIVRKVYFPKETVVLGVILSSLVDLVIGVVLLLGISYFLGANLGINLLFLPLLMVVIILPVVAVSLPLAALYVYYRDIRYALPLAIQLWMYASPVVYPLTKVPQRWRLLYAFLNPVAGPLYGFFRVVAVGASPDWTLLGASLLSGCVILQVGHLVFRRLQPQFADVI
jgi:lipopolysaccharide transport system permease protein